RTNSGTKEPTDLNALADEYLRLAYHGLRAKDSSFQADYTTDFDPTIPLINVNPQDIGRVLLNIINNAFQACHERCCAQIHPDYAPKVTISTKNRQSFIEIRIQDNGSGIPDAIKDKIFQPFFTTKPTGKGTGLGLSLSYDIVKAHGGELGVDSKEGVETEFIISLPTP
ncbi:MAG: HAMP domain-containing histidine kinase, partial [Bacteroidetes bacterium]|nr:HAMP domain-containing histidine kinase [Bacteroidota bacterium]